MGPPAFHRALIGLRAGSTLAADRHNACSGTTGDGCGTRHGRAALSLDDPEVVRQIEAIAERVALQVTRQDR
jgi:hypothetical protein